MREHLYEKKSQKVSLTTIHRLVETPNNAFNSGIRYKGLINARVGAKVTVTENLILMPITYLHEIKCEGRCPLC